MIGPAIICFIVVVAAVTVTYMMKASSPGPDPDVVAERARVRREANRAVWLIHLTTSRAIEEMMAQARRQQELEGGDR